MLRPSVRMLHTSSWIGEHRHNPLSKQNNALIGNLEFRTHSFCHFGSRVAPLPRSFSSGTPAPSPVVFDFSFLITEMSEPEQNGGLEIRFELSTGCVVVSVDWPRSTLTTTTHARCITQQLVKLHQTACVQCRPTSIYFVIKIIGWVNCTALVSERFSSFEHPIKDY